MYKEESKGPESKGNKTTNLWSLGWLWHLVEEWSFLATIFCLRSADHMTIFTRFSSLHACTLERIRAWPCRPFIGDIMLRIFMWSHCENKIVSWQYLAQQAQDINSTNENVKKIAQGKRSYCGHRAPRSFNSLGLDWWHQQFLLLKGSYSLNYRYDGRMLHIRLGSACLPEKRRLDAWPADRVCAVIYVCMCVFMYVCMYVWT